MSNNSKQIKKLTILVMAATIIKDAISFLTAPIFVRMMSKSEYGIVSLFSSWTAIFTQIIGLRTYSALSNGRVEFEEKEYRQFVSNSICVSAICGLVLIALSILFRFQLSNLLLLPVNMIPLVFIQSFGAYCLTFYSCYQTQDKKQIKSILFSTLALVISVVLSCVVIKNTGFAPSFGRVLTHTIVYVVIGPLVCIGIAKNIKYGFKVNYLRYSLSISIPMIGYALSGVLLNQTDRIMLKAMIGNESVAIYNAALLLASVLTIIWQALNTTWQPFYFEYIKDGHFQEIEQHLKTFSRSLLLLTIGFMLVSPEIFLIWVGEPYAAGLPILPIAAIGFYILFLDGIPCMYLLQKKQTKQIMLGIVIPAIINIGLNYLFIKYYKLLGAIYATLISYIFCYLIHRWIVKRRYHNIGYSLLPSWVDIILLLIAWIVCMLTQNLTFVRWGIAIAVGIFLTYHIKKKGGLI